MTRTRLALLILLAFFVGASTYGITVAAHEDAEDEHEETVELEKVPDAVKATILKEILREVDELHLEELELEDDDDRVIYEAEFEYGGREIELEITADGKLIRKEVEVDEEGDEDADEEKKDKDEDNEEATTTKVMMKLIDTHQHRLI